ncbi:uncharacterized protein LOC135218269 [Macrobrachium nipponense]|uniref:uncharacterized protein LOC135218269 n=1 Tax=Macrobrachium nipponense TaxID=159736 RepID=UPI0030C895A4
MIAFKLALSLTLLVAYACADGIHGGFGHGGFGHGGFGGHGTSFGNFVNHGSYGGHRGFFGGHGGGFHGLRGGYGGGGTSYSVVNLGPPLPFRGGGYGGGFNHGGFSGYGK